ncbi:MAG: hypothetical protein PHR06_14875 [Candidatus Cloacimonetes bacterium]|nr:hypothetical protein [Candidatus Cloacimonadota bacterium]
MSGSFKEKMKKISKAIIDDQSVSITSLLGSVFSPEFLESLNQKSFTISEEAFKKKLAEYLSKDDSYTLENTKIDEKGIEVSLSYQKSVINAKIFLILFISKLVINSSEQLVVLHISEHKLEGANLITKIISPIIEVILDSILAKKVSKLHMHYDINNQDISVNLAQFDIIKQLSFFSLPIIKTRILDQIQITGIEHCKGCIAVKFDVNSTIEKLFRHNSEGNKQNEGDIC